MDLRDDKTNDKNIAYIIMCHAHLLDWYTDCTCALYYYSTAF